MQEGIGNKNSLPKGLNRIILDTMHTTLCLAVYCPACGEHIRLPLESLGHMFGNPGLRTIDASFLVFPCPFCKNVEAYSLNDDSPYKRPGYTVMLLIPPEAPILNLGWLECEEPSCQARVPLFVEWSETTNEAERIADTETWKWDRLLCPEGHVIRKPCFSPYL